MPCRCTRIDAILVVSLFFQVYASADSTSTVPAPLRAKPHGLAPAPSGGRRGHSHIHSPHDRRPLLLLLSLLLPFRDLPTPSAARQSLSTCFRFSVSAKDARGGERRVGGAMEPFVVGRRGRARPAFTHGACDVRRALRRRPRGGGGAARAHPAALHQSDSAERERVLLGAGARSGFDHPGVVRR